MGAGEALLNRIITFVIDPGVAVLFTAGLFFFLYGLVEFLWGLREGKANDEGKQHMLWGMVGMLIMVSVYGIVSILTNTLGIDIANPDISRVQDVNPGINFTGQ